MLTEQEIRDRYEAYCEGAALKRIGANKSYAVSNILSCRFWAGSAVGIGSVLGIDVFEVNDHIEQLVKKLTEENEAKTS